MAVTRDRCSRISHQRDPYCRPKMAPHTGHHPIALTCCIGAAACVNGAEGRASDDPDRWVVTTAMVPRLAAPRLTRTNPQDAVDDQRSTDLLQAGNESIGLPRTDRTE
jgi:hypothetical protein